MAKDTFVFYREWMPLVNTLPDASRLIFYDMMCAYDGGEIPASGDPHLDGVVKFVFQKVLENNKKYAEKCGKATIAANKRWDANAYGRIETHTDAMPSDANVKSAMLNDNDNDNVNDTDLKTTPMPPSPNGSGEKEKKRKSRKTRVEMTRDKAIIHYKTESEAAIVSAPAEGEKYANLGREICGMKTLECPNGMVDTLMKLPEQLGFDQYLNLCRIMGGHATVRSILLEMHNGYEEYLTKRHSINLIAQDWYKNRLKREAREAKSNGQSPQSTGTLSAPKAITQ